MKRQNTILYFLWILGITLYIATNTLAVGQGSFAGDSVGARASILGGGFVAIADDANALRWNPAGIVQLLQPEVTSSHINFFSLGGYFDYSSNSNAINEDFIGLVLPNHTAPVGISFLNLGTSGMPYSDESGAIIDSNANYAERMLTLSVGKRFKLKSIYLSAGGNLNRFSIGGRSDNSGFGMDGGFLLETPGILPEFGLMLRGLFMDTTLGKNGPTIPAKTDVAMAFRPWKSLKLVGGLSKTSGDSIVQYSTGFEFRFPLPIAVKSLFSGRIQNIGHARKRHA